MTKKLLLSVLSKINVNSNVSFDTKCNNKECTGQFNFVLIVSVCDSA